MRNAFTVDVEDFFQVSAFERWVPRDAWDQFSPRVVANTRRLLELLDRHRTAATFFFLGWVADRFPELVRDIHAAGHEIGSHGYEHKLIYEQTPEEFRSDIRRSKKVLEDTVSQPVAAYRAPSFSITAKSLWACEILVEEGFRLKDHDPADTHHLDQEDKPRSQALLAEGHHMGVIASTDDHLGYPGAYREGLAAVKAAGLTREDLHEGILLGFGGFAVEIQSGLPLGRGHVTG